MDDSGDFKMNAVPSYFYDVYNTLDDEKVIQEEMCQLIIRVNFPECQPIAIGDFEDEDIDNWLDPDDNESFVDYEDEPDVVMDIYYESLV